MENVKKANESLEYMKTTAVGNQKNDASYQQLLTDAYTSAQFLLTQVEMGILEELLPVFRDSLFFEDKRREIP